MTKLIRLFVVLLLLTGCSKTDESKLIIKTENGDLVYRIELADTPEKLMTGLMNRTSLKAQTGMLFDLSDMTNGITAMWMKDTKIPLDMIFIDETGTIYWINENAEPDSEELIVPPMPATAVLEINGGEAAAKQIKIGQSVEHPIFAKFIQKQNKTSEGTANSEETSQEVITPQVSEEETALPLQD